MRRHGREVRQPVAFIALLSIQRYLRPVETIVRVIERLLPEAQYMDIEILIDIEKALGMTTFALGVMDAGSGGSDFGSVFNDSPA